MTALAVTSLHAQMISINSTNLLTLFQLAGLEQQLAGNQLFRIGTPFTLTTSAGQQTFLVTTNPAGLYTLSTSGPNGTNSFTPPNNPNDWLGTAETWVAANNPANATFYGTNELDFKVGALYLQNSGQAVASLGVTKYGLFGWSSIGIGAGILQGNNGGSSGTAGAYGLVEYRKVMGDVAANLGVIGGYDKWNESPFFGAKAGLEYRQSAHLGEFIDVAYAFEPSKSKNNDRGLLIGGGVEVAF